MYYLSSESDSFSLMKDVIKHNVPLKYHADNNFVFNTFFTLVAKKVRTKAGNTRVYQICYH